LLWNWRQLQIHQKSERDNSREENGPHLFRIQDMQEGTFKLL